MKLKGSFDEKEEMEEVMFTDNELEQAEEAFMKNETERRFAMNSTTDVEMHQQVRVPASTKTKQQSCVRLFKLWHTEWKMREDMLKVYDDLEYMGASDLSYCLKYFIADVRKQNGSKYPPKTLKGIFAMIQHYMNYDCGKNWSFFKDDEFKDARNQLDAEMRLSAIEGNVKPTKRAENISFSDEEDLWKEGILGSGNPKQLQDTVIYLMGVQFGLRAATEHKALRFGVNSQLQLIEENSEEVLVYTETVSKNKNFGIKQSRIEPKSVRVFPRKTLKERCLVNLYKKYVSKRPITDRTEFHLACIINPKTTVWYKNAPLGIHSLEKVTKTLMKSLGKEGYYTNTSLRRSAKTRLVEAGIPREVTKKRIGHISTSDEVYVAQTSMERDMCEILSGEHSTNQVDLNFEKTSGSGSTSHTLVFNNCSFSGCNF